MRLRLRLLGSLSGVAFWGHRHQALTASRPRPCHEGVTGAPLELALIKHVPGLICASRNKARKSGKILSPGHFFGTCLS